MTAAYCSGAEHWMAYLGTGRNRSYWMTAPEDRQAKR